MNITVDIEPSAVNQQIAQAVIDSQLGLAIKERIETFLNQKSSYDGRPTLNSEMARAVDVVIRDIIVNLIKSDYKTAIEQKVREKLTSDVIAEMTIKAIDKFTRY